MGNIEPPGKCEICGIVTTIDTAQRICFECWNNLVIAEAEEE